MFNKLRCDTEKVYPKQAGKAAHIKILLIWMADELKLAALVIPTPEVKVAATAAWAIADFIFVCNDAGMIMTEEQASRGYNSGMTYLFAYRELACISKVEKSTRWKYRPKVHFLEHQFIEMLHTKFNPNYSSCFMDEDYIGKIARLAGKCHAKTVGLRALQRYFILLTMRSKAKQVVNKVRKTHLKT